MFSFYTSLKHETSGFLIFLVGIVGEHSPKMDLKKGAGFASLQCENEGSLFKYKLI